MNRFSLLRPVVVLLIAVGLVTVPTRASAQERPHFSRGTAQFVPTGFVGAGNATHLGNYTEDGTVSISGQDRAALLLTGGA